MRYLIANVTQGKTLIHPTQIETANTAFAPSIEAVDRARRLIAAYTEALERGEGVVVFDGQLVENLHVASALRVLAVSEAIDAQTTCGSAFEEITI